MSLVPLARTPTSPVPQNMWSRDELVQLRVWASEQVFSLPLEGKKMLMGTGPDCAIRVHDSLVSREHAQFERDGEHWCISDRSKNGLYLDGVAHGKAFLGPGTRITLGPRLSLVAESARTIALRAALARMMGWGLADALDVALQNLRFAVIGKTAFMVCGKGDLLGFAQELHGLAIGEHHPFVYCRPGGGGARESSGSEGEGLASIKRVVSGGEWLTLAQSSGTLCIDNRRLPEDLDSILERLHDASSPMSVLLIVLSRHARKREVFTPAPFVIPPLSARRPELERLMVECESLAAAKLKMGPLMLTSAQRTWLRGRCKTLAELQASILRLLAVRHAGSVPGAAALLGMTASGLWQWLAARELATD